ncbi:MAG: cysteine synthase family protein [Deltaproteobacteria bacterium]|nr:cysteine synthase family protein [Deltaproteobacteria bacterium]
MESLLEAIGHTPLVELKRCIPQTGGRVFAKLECFNPGGSLKDRVILKILTDAEKNGLLHEGSTIVAGTTGNSGIALAYIGGIKKYKVILTMPENYSLERRKILEGYGAEVHLTPASEEIRGAIGRAKVIASERNGTLINQFENPLTIAAHEEGTAVEIDTALASPVDAVVACVGTGGSLMGVGGYFKKRGARVIAVEPASAPLLSAGRTGPHKIQGIGTGFIPRILKRELIDEILVVSDNEALEGSLEIAQKEGILVGISSGAALVGARTVAQKLGLGKKVVTLFADRGERYFSLDKFFAERKGDP